MQQAADFDHAQMMSAALAANESIQAEARAVYGDNLTDQQSVDRVIAARWPNLPERDAYAAAADHYEVAAPALEPTADPLTQFLTTGVPLRVLLEHGAERLDWLAALDISPIVMTYPDGQGGMIVEEVSKVGLIERAHQLGWKPSKADEADEVVFSRAISWEDDEDALGAVRGLWYAQEECVDFSINAGTPLAIPLERFQAIKREAEARHAKCREVLAQCEADALLHAEAKRVDALCQSRVAGRLQRDGEAISFGQAYAEVLAIAAAQGVDPDSDDTLPAWPWSSNATHEVAKVMRFVNDVALGTPAPESFGPAQFLAEQAA